MHGMYVKINVKIYSPLTTKNLPDITSKFRIVAIFVTIHSTTNT